MLAFLQRFGPTGSTLAAVLGLVLALTVGGVRDFVWADLKEGTIRLRGLSLSVRGLVWIGFGLLFAMLGVLLFNDAGRAFFPLLPSLGPVTGRGSLIPTALLPLTVFMLSLAWTFALAGTLYSHPLIRLAVLLLYLSVGTLWGYFVFVTGLGSPSPLLLLIMLLMLGGMVGVLLLFATSRWIKPSPEVAFTLLLALVGITQALAHLQNVSDLQVTGIPLVLGHIGLSLIVLKLLIIPLLLLIGVDIADFTRQAARWPIEIISARLPGSVLLVALLLLLGWRLWVVAVDVAGQLAIFPLAELLYPYGGALGIPLGLALSWGLITRQGPVDEEGVDEAVQHYALPIILIYYVAQLLDSYIPGPELLIVVSGAALLVGLGLAWRGRRALALYLLLVAFVHLWSRLTELDAPLRRFYWDRPETLEFWWVLLFTGVTVGWGVRRRLTPARAEQMLFLLMVITLLRQTDFIENPFSPFFAFAGIGFIAFGIAWDVITAGSWANLSTPALPRVSRIFLYIGYMLITVTVINWALTTHDLSWLETFTGGGALAGLTRFGRPLLYAIFAITLTQAARVEPPPSA